MTRPQRAGLGMVLLLISLGTGFPVSRFAFADSATSTTGTTPAPAKAPAQPAAPAQPPSSKPPASKPAATPPQNGQQPAAQKQPTNPKPPPDNTELLPPKEVMPLMGSKVRDQAGEDMGMVVDVVVDLEGKPRALVIDFGGFLGVGSRKIAIDWRLVHLQPENHDAPVLLHLGRAEVQNAPEFVPDVEPLRMLGPPSAPPASPNAGQ
jgi:PRC-barrel domain